MNILNTRRQSPARSMRCQTMSHSHPCLVLFSCLLKSAPSGCDPPHTPARSLSCYPLLLHTTRASGEMSFGCLDRPFQSLLSKSVPFLLFAAHLHPQEHRLGQFSSPCLLRASLDLLYPDNPTRPLTSLGLWFPRVSQI